MNYLLFIMHLLFVLQSWLQPTAEVTIDKRRMIIGEPFRLVVSLRGMPANAQIKWQLPDTLPHFEYLQVDSSQPARLVLQLTSFDSGVHRVEGISAVINTYSGSKVQLIKPQAAQIAVMWDTTLQSKMLQDISEVSALPYTGVDYPAYLLVITGGIAWLLLYQSLSGKNKRAAVAKNVWPQVDAYREFQQNINTIKQNGWLDLKVKSRQFQQLVLVCKHYFEKRTGQRLQHLTTDEFLLWLKTYFPQNTLVSFAAALRLADAVKFAAYDAPPADCAEALAQVELFIDMAEQTISKPNT